MLKTLNPDQVHFMALLAKAARMQRDELLGGVAEDDLAEPKAARGEHNPTAALGFAPLRPESSQLTALREAVATLSLEGRSELYTLMRIGQGDLAHVPAKWTRFADEEHAPHMNLERIHALTCREAVQHQRDAL